MCPAHLPSRQGGRGIRGTRGRFAVLLSDSALGPSCHAVCGAGGHLRGPGPGRRPASGRFPPLPDGGPAGLPAAEPSGVDRRGCRCGDGGAGDSPSHRRPGIRRRAGGTAGGFAPGRGGRDGRAGPARAPSLR
ncbi:MAG: hypothetical protein E6J20_03390 [Chloroflexi bacterium]|nr:MAG: hypothetical protein E6J20_03390 [Chloroflexota bacterium]